MGNRKLPQFNLDRPKEQRMDPILFWNGVALEANRVSHTNGMGEQTGPTLSSRALAIVHLAMYDAYAAVFDDATELPPYLTGLPAVGAGASEDAAVAAAAHKPANMRSKKGFWLGNNSDSVLWVTRPTRDMRSE